MTQQRRTFLRNTLLSTSLLLVQKPLRSLAEVSQSAMQLPGNNRELMIWHTSDLHGQLSELLPAGDQHLRLDAGDFIDNHGNAGTNTEMVRAMNKAGYHVANIGHHELANGQAALAALLPQMQFTLVNCNYLFSNRTLSREVLRYKIVYMGKLKVGITGVGPELPASSGVKYLPPVENANAMATTLKKEHGCDVVICLSHLPDNIHIATESAHIDLVVGAHQQSIHQSAMVLRNALGNEVYLNQTSMNGKMAGNVKMLFNEDGQGCGVRPGYVIA
jgi:5'-nucleotidase